MNFILLESSGGILLSGTLATILVMTGMAGVGTRVGVSDRVSYYFREMTHLSHLSVQTYVAIILFFPIKFPYQNLLAVLVLVYGLATTSRSDYKNWKHDKEQSLIPQDQLDKLSVRGRTWPNRLFLFGTDREKVKRIEQHCLRLQSIEKKLEEELLYFEQEPAKPLSLVAIGLAILSVSPAVWKDRAMLDQLRPYFLSRPLFSEHLNEFLREHVSSHLLAEITSADEEAHELAALLRCHEGR